MRFVIATQIDRLFCYGKLGILSERMPGVRVSVEAGEVAARNFESNPVPCLKQVAGDAHVDLIAIDSVRLDRRRIGTRFPKISPYNSGCQVLGITRQNSFLCRVFVAA